MPKTIKYIGSQVRWPELSATGKQAVWYPGQQEERSDSDAAALLATGQFDNLSDDTFTPAAAGALNALVSVDGNVTAAALPSLVGTPGQLVRLSDGDNAGALLVWAIPDGSASYAWCWQIWPRAAYF